MNTALHVACPHCHSINRVPADKLGAGGKCGRCHKALFEGQPVELDDAGFEAHVNRSDLPVLVDFWAPWCGPCRMMAPAFAQAAAHLEPKVRLAKVNTEEKQALASRFGIRSIPTLVLFNNGREKARVSGAMDLRQLLAWAQQNI